MSERDEQVGLLLKSLGTAFRAAAVELSECDLSTEPEVDCAIRCAIGALGRAFQKVGDRVSEPEIRLN